MKPYIPERVQLQMRELGAGLQLLQLLGLHYCTSTVTVGHDPRHWGLQAACNTVGGAHIPQRKVGEAGQGRQDPQQLHVRGRVRGWDWMSDHNAAT
eukprot:scaffold320587_cov26-Tisochrysis_lutea.AAC.1